MAMSQRYRNDFENSDSAPSPFNVIAWRMFWIVGTFLFTGAVIGTAIYVSAVFIMPLILTQLSPVALTLGLTAISPAFTLGLVGLIAVLPLVFAIMIGLKWAILHKDLFGKSNKQLGFSRSFHIFKDIKNWVFNLSLKSPATRYLGALLGSVVTRNKGVFDEEQGRKMDWFQVSTFLAALGVAISLFSSIGSLAPAMAALGIASGVIALSQCFLAIAVTIMIYELLALCIQLNNLKLFLKNKIDNPKAKPLDLKKRILYGIGVCALIISTAVISSVFFLPLIHALTPLVGSTSMAGFLAVVTSYALLMLMLRTANLFVNGLGIIEKQLFSAQPSYPLEAVSCRKPALSNGFRQPDSPYNINNPIGDGLQPGIAQAPPYASRAAK